MRREFLPSGSWIRWLQNYCAVSIITSSKKPRHDLGSCVSNNMQTPRRDQDNRQKKCTHVVFPVAFAAGALLEELAAAALALAAGLPVLEDFAGAASAVSAPLAASGAADGVALAAGAFAPPAPAELGVAFATAFEADVARTLRGAATDVPIRDSARIARNFIMNVVG